MPTPSLWGRGKSRLSGALSSIILIEQSKTLETLYGYFPSLPRFPVATVKGKELIFPSSKSNPFLLYFNSNRRSADETRFQPDETSPLAPQVRRALEVGLNTIESSVRFVETYLPEADPSRNETHLKLLSASLLKTPGFRNWLHLINGVSDFEGELGDPKLIERRLVEYIRYNESNSGASNSLFSTLLSAFGSFYRRGDFSEAACGF